MKNFKKIVFNCLFNFFVCVSFVSSFVVAQEVSPAKASKTVTWAAELASRQPSNRYGLRPRKALIVPRKTVKTSSIKKDCTNSSVKQMVTEENDDIAFLEQRTQEELHLAAIREKQAKKRRERLAKRLQNVCMYEEQLLDLLNGLTERITPQAASIAAIGDGISRLTISSTSVVTSNLDNAELDAEVVAQICKELEG